MQHEENKWIIYQSWLRSDFSRVMNWGVVELRIGFLSFFSPLSIPLLSLSLPSSAYEQRGVYTTHREIIDPWRNHWRIVRGWLIPRRWLPGQWLLLRGNLCCFSLFLCLICVLKQGFFVYWYNPPPSFPKNVCVFTYSNKAFLCIKSFWGKILRFWIRHLSSWKEKSQNSVENFFLMDVLIADCDF